MADGTKDKPKDPKSNHLRTPLYLALNAARYERQGLIRDIQAQTETRLICYVAGSNTFITRDDVLPFHDLLRNIDKDTNVDLLLHTTGGLIDPAEKIVNMIRDRVGEGVFRIIVPDYAKSAGTLMVLGADSVVMSDSSELGPIDPQFRYVDQYGRTAWVSVQHYLNAYDQHSKDLTEEPDSIASELMLSKLDPVIRQNCLSTNQRARKLAEELLSKGMFVNNRGNTTQTALDLMDTKRWHEHSQAILWYQAKSEPRSLNVEHMDAQNELWQLYWRLYCMQCLVIDENQKLFESDFASIVWPVETHQPE